MQQSDQDVRAFLIAETFRFIDRIVAIPGLRRIAMLGSLIGSKANPNDVDILITIDDEADLTALATAARNLKGITQSKNKRISKLDTIRRKARVSLHSAIFQFMIAVFPGCVEFLQRFIMAKILVVDDDDQTIALLENMIKLNGHKPISVGRSQFAIQRAREEIPDLVLLDIMMPEVNGIELCKMFKSDPDLQHIPVIMVSALSDEGSKRDSFHAGAQDFLTKPLLAGDFAKKLHSVFG